MDLSRSKQNLLFDVSREFALVSEVRDIIDELTIIQHIYRDQLSILQALWTAQYHQALWHWGLGQDTPETPNGSEAGRLPQDPKALEDRLRRAEYIPAPEINWDPRSWFKRTRDYMESHHQWIVNMQAEVLGVYDALQNTISLKQNSASIFEAHATRREGEAIMLFTLVSSTFLPLSFFVGVFGMNVVGRPSIARCT
jgi:CorA-like Mg2+ transporter protein